MIGTGEHASQHGMNIGGIRHASDIKADDMTPQSQGMLHPQTGDLCFLNCFPEWVFIFICNENFQTFHLYAIYDRLQAQVNMPHSMV